MEPRARRAVRSSRCWWAPLRRCPPSSAWSSASGKKVRAAREPAQVARMIVARLHCTCYAPAPPPARLDLMLTTPACALSAAPVRPGGDSMRSPDEPEYTELLYERQRVGPGTSAPSRRTLAVCATMLLYLAAEDKAWRRAGGWWRGGGPAGGWRVAASRCGLARRGWLGAWTSGGRARSSSGAPVDFRCKGVVSAPFCTVLLDFVFARVPVSMCARTYDKVKLVSCSRPPWHVVDGRARSGERSSQLWTGVENRDLRGYEG